MARFVVKGMSCGHCVAAVRKAVGDVVPEATVSVDLARGMVDVTGTARMEEVAASIRAAGYEVQPAPAR